jgi:hypothetical protein
MSPPCEYDSNRSVRFNERARRIVPENIRIHRSLADAYFLPRDGQRAFCPIGGDSFRLVAREVTPDPANGHEAL